MALVVEEGIGVGADHLCGESLIDQRLGTGRIRKVGGDERITPGRRRIPGVLDRRIVVCPMP
jgi:hypothetical protein